MTLQPSIATPSASSPTVVTANEGTWNGQPAVWIKLSCGHVLVTRPEGLSVGAPRYCAQCGC